MLAPLLEENFRRALLVSGGDITVFVTRPISLGFLMDAIVEQFDRMIMAIHKVLRAT